MKLRRTKFAGLGARGPPCVYGTLLLDGMEIVRPGSDDADHLYSGDNLEFARDTTVCVLYSSAMHAAALIRLFRKDWPNTFDDKGDRRRNTTTASRYIADHGQMSSRHCAVVNPLKLG